MHKTYLIETWIPDDVHAMLLRNRKWSGGGSPCTGGTEPTELNTWSQHPTHCNTYRIYLVNDVLELETARYND